MQRRRKGFQGQKLMLKHRFTEDIFILILSECIIERLSLSLRLLRRSGRLHGRWGCQGGWRIGSPRPGAPVIRGVTQTSAARLWWAACPQSGVSTLPGGSYGTGWPGSLSGRSGGMAQPWCFLRHLMIVLPMEGIIAWAIWRTDNLPPASRHIDSILSQWLNIDEFADLSRVGSSSP